MAFRKFWAKLKDKVIEITRCTVTGPTRTLRLQVTDRFVRIQRAAASFVDRIRALPYQQAKMRIFLAIRAFFAILFGQTLPGSLPGGTDRVPASNDASAVKLRAELEASKSEASAQLAQISALELELQDQPAPNETIAAAAVQVLALMQSEARLLDFLSEDITDYSDEDVGAAVRDVHRGLQAAIKDHFPVAPVRSEEEDSPITIPKGFDPHEIRLVGNVIGEAPFAGTINHRGWRVEKVILPTLSSGKAAMIAAPAEVEI
jgi:hypothetical protein